MRDPLGYGTIRRGRPSFKNAPVHRVAYELLIGPIPNGLHIDHLCRNPPCVNPWHLEPVLNGVNILRGVSFSAVNARKTHCKRGHEFTPENTRLANRGTHFGRVCRKCRRATGRKFKRVLRGSVKTRVSKYDRQEMAG